MAQAMIMLAQAVLMLAHAVLILAHGGSRHTQARSVCVAGPSPEAPAYVSHHL